MKQGEAKEALARLLEEANKEYPTVEFRYNEKYQQLRLGQICRICGLFIWFDEDKNIEEMGMCMSCQEEQDELEEIEKRRKPLTAMEEDLIYEKE